MTPTALLLTGGATEHDAVGWAGELLQVAAGGAPVVAAASAPVAGRTTPPLWLGLANPTLATGSSRSGASSLRAAAYAAVGRPLEAGAPLHHHSAVVLLLPHPSSTSAPVSNAIVIEEEVVTSLIHLAASFGLPFRVAHVLPRDAPLADAIATVADARLIIYRSGDAAALAALAPPLALAVEAVPFGWVAAPRETRPSDVTTIHIPCPTAAFATADGGRYTKWTHAECVADVTGCAVAAAGAGAVVDVDAVADAAAAALGEGAQRGER